MLLNPVRRRSNRRARRVHRNPVRRRTTSAAIRRKISLAVKAANRRRGGGGSKRRSVARVSRRRTARRSSPVMALAVRSPRRRSLARRRSFSVSRRRSVRRRSGGFGGGSIGFKSLFDKQTLMLAGAAAGGQLATRFVLTNYSDKLPFVRNADGTVNTYGVAAYQVGIPVIAALIIKKWNPTLAKGLILGGMITGMNVILNQLMAMTASAPAVTAPAATNAYIEPMGANPPGYDAVNAFSGVYDPQPAFSGDAWSR